MYSIHAGFSFYTLLFYRILVHYCWIMKMFIHDTMKAKYHIQLKKKIEALSYVQFTLYIVLSALYIMICTMYTLYRI